MTGQADFTAEEWKQVLDGPPSAALVVALAQRGGSFRESFSIAKSYTEARQAHGDSQLLDEIVSVKPHIDHTRHSSFEEVKTDFLGRLGKAVGLVQQKGTPEVAFRVAVKHGKVAFTARAMKGMKEGEEE